jgi:hypothetical protein
MILVTEDQSINNNSINLSLIEIESATEIYPADTNYKNTSITNKIVYTILSDSFEFFNYFSNYLSNIAINLQNHCFESSFEFKILTVLLLALLSILVLISIAWKIFGSRIDHFYRHQEYYINKKPVASNKTSKNIVKIFQQKAKVH